MFWTDIVVGIKETLRGTTYCSLAHHFDLHSHHHGHTHTAEEHTIHYDIETSLDCSAVLKETEYKEAKSSFFNGDVMRLFYYLNSSHCSLPRQNRRGSQEYGHTAVSGCNRPH